MNSLPEPNLKLLNRRKRRRGAAVVEFAVVAPVFFILVFGMIEYGRAVMVEQILTNAAREGARVAILTSATTANVTSEVTTYLSNASITGATVTISPNPPATAAAGTTVSVTVSIPFTSVSWLPSPFYLGSTTLSAKCSMRTEQTGSGS